MKVGITLAVAVLMAVWLPRSEGTIWGKYYVIIGYLLSLGLIAWIVLRLLHYLGSNLIVTDLREREAKTNLAYSSDTRGGFSPARSDRTRPAATSADSER